MSQRRSEPEHGPVDVVQSALDHIRREEEFQELVHQLSHRGMDYAAKGRIDEVEQVFAEALALARERNLPRWEAQILFNTGVIFDRSAKPVVAIGYFERALSFFAEHGPLRMEVNVSIFLGNMLWKTGEPSRAERVLQHALRQARLGYETKQIPLNEYENELFGVYRELGQTYQALGQFGRALETYQLALRDGVPGSFDELHALDLAVLDLYRDIGAFQGAVDFGEQLLGQSNPATAQDLQFLSKVTFSLGIACSMAEDYTASLSYTTRSYHYFQTSRDLLARSPLLPEADDMAFRGRVLVNLGTAFHGLARIASLEKNEASWLRNVKAALAFWRHGEELLAQAEAEDVTVPRAQLAAVRAAFQHSETFEQLLQESLATCQELLKALGMDETSETLDLAVGEVLVDLGAVGSFDTEDLEDIEESERLILEGRCALLKKVYWKAQECFEEALDFDPVGRTCARFWYALSCLWTGDLDEAVECFEEVADEGDIEGPGAVARILAEWSVMCRYPSRQAYWDWLRELYGCESEEELLEMLEPFEEDAELCGAEGTLHAGLLYVVQGDCEACLRALASTDATGHAFSPWIRSFWQAMAEASRGEEEPAAELLRAALTLGMPPLLMGPLRWLKPADADPTSWFTRVAQPLFVAHDHLYDEYPGPTPPDGPPSLPSQAAKIAPIRRGLPLITEGPGEGEGEHELELTLSGARSPGGKASLAFVEFDAGEGEEQERVLWPTKFAVRYTRAPADIAQSFQEFWIDYTPGRMPVMLIDRGFRPMTDAIPTAGRDFLVGHGSYVGRGGTFWVAQGSGLPVHAFGTATRLVRLPPGTLGYLQALVDEALPFVEMYCERCDQQTMQVNGVWCEHTWICPRCQHISSPIERSRKLMGASPCYCPHRFPKSSEPEVRAI